MAWTGYNGTVAMVTTLLFVILYPVSVLNSLSQIHPRRYFHYEWISIVTVDSVDCYVGIAYSRKNYKQFATGLRK